MVAAPFPYPARNPQYPKVSDILFSELYVNTPDYRAMYERSQGNEAKTWRFQYLALEQQLEQSFFYVSPTDENAAAFSLKFAEIIRGAANAYEIFAKELYARFYSGTDKLNIFNYLALDIFLQLSKQTVTHFAMLGPFPNHPEVFQPFVKLQAWDKNSVPTSAHVPDWWNAYNAVKHSNAGLKRATLANAVSATAALFLLIERVFGFGVLQGGFFDEPSESAVYVKTRNHPSWARLFVRI